MTINRRHALTLFALAPVGVSAAETKPYAGAVGFDHGVASGDPQTDRVILWTRVTPKAARGGSLLVNWELAGDRAFRRLVAHGSVATGPSRDFTVKVDATGLKPGREYFYRFRFGKTVSPVGRTRTLPQGGIKDAVLAFVTCALYPNGYFNAYDHIAKLARVDAVVELGDYYYEYGAADGDYGMVNGKKLGRIPEPPHEIVTLADYRMRHALYKRDADLQAAHARAPWICVWDDHETANDSWAGGAEDHNPAVDGAWPLREAAALQAYYEWMPIREPAHGKSYEAINRSFHFGDLASLIMLESRLLARSRQLELDQPGDIPLAVYDSHDATKRRRVTDSDIVTRVLASAKSRQPIPAPYMLGPDMDALNAIINDPERQMLGPVQEEWLALEIANSVKSGKRWQVFGNQVVMARGTTPDIQKAMGGRAKVEAVAARFSPEAGARLLAITDMLTFNLPFDYDGWNGYPAARERVYDAIKQSNANVVVVSGDSHSFWVNELYDDKHAVRVAAEIGVSSVTSPSVGESLPGLDFGGMMAAENPEVLLNDQTHKGYVLLTLTADKVVADLVAVEIDRKPYEARTVHRWQVSPADGPGIGAIEDISGA